ncbi:helix-turn-helix domain-containing protein [Actinomadura monticuli]|uniref:Helix-turn-helix transcriptional regulator n=1 Tax=Actinomadura monticuli TaxID=3097367 RepID=A0ABV4Q9D5_9ACTN
MSSQRTSPHVLLGDHPGLAAKRDTDEYRLAHEEACLALALGRAVYVRRTELGMSQTELARRAGMRQPAVSRIESGGGGVPTLAVLNRLGHALGLRFRVIVGEGDAGAAETELLAIA